MIDLHIHTTHSDGRFTPAGIVRASAAEGLSLIAIADHDSVSGIDEAVDVGAETGVEVIPAVELSVIYRGMSDIHLLGYGIDHHDPLFGEKLTLFQKRRDTRSQAIVERINGRLRRRRLPPIDYGEVLKLAGGAIGRPHIARVLMDHGLVTSMEEAFEEYLVPCNVPKEYFPLEEAIGEIHRIGGVAVLAHPTGMTRDRGELVRLVDRFMEQGLDGLEIYHNMVDPEESSFLRSLAEERGMVMTGGSDFHGIGEGERLGVVRDGLVIPDELGRGLLTRIRRAAP